jgi:HEAT repeat protein
MGAHDLDTIDIDDLIARALAVEDREDDRYAELVGALQRRGDRATFERAVALCRDPSDWARRLGADVLGQLGRERGTEHVAASLPVVIALCAAGGSPDLLRDALLALGQLGDPRGIDVALAHVRHPDADVRFGVIHALAGIGGEQPAPAIVDAAIELTRDPDQDVRNWATSVLGLAFATDTPGLRDALAARIADDDAATRAEALAGLVARRDPRAAEPVIAWFARAEREDDEYVRDLMVETAARLADPRCLPGLRALADRNPDDPFGGWLELALSTCAGEPFPELEDI